jgi:radical SAM/Cys-rich protein
MKGATKEVQKNERYDFQAALQKFQLDLTPLAIETLQVNITRLCNQACRHCHVDASPHRTEQMNLHTINRCLEILATTPIPNLDITGGAPELNPHFDYFVIEARKLEKHVMVRHNLTVTLDGNPQTGESKSYLPRFFAEQQVEVISSLPFYESYFTDKQRGRGVFGKSIEALRRLNAEGYGHPETGLVLDLVYNPVGAFLPAPQACLETDFKQRLSMDYGLVFNRLYTLTNMPIHRFEAQLLQLGVYDEYMTKLIDAFNPAAAQGVMCRNLISVGYDGKLYDCDFNQMLDMQIVNHQPRTVFDFDFVELVTRSIQFSAHCFGCTAGFGSGCAGATTSPGPNALSKTGVVIE